MNWQEALKAMEGGAVVERDGAIFEAVQIRMGGHGMEGRILDEGEWDPWDPYSYHVAHEATSNFTYRLAAKEAQP